MLKQKLYYTNQKLLFFLKKLCVWRKGSPNGIACFLMMISFIQSISLPYKNTQNCSSEPWFIQLNKLAQRLPGWRRWLPSMLPLFSVMFYIEVEGIKIPATLYHCVGWALHKRAWLTGWNLAWTQGLHLASTWKKGTYFKLDQRC